MAAYADDAWWVRYAEYVDESLPRHAAALGALGIFPRQDVSLLDLGCGQTREGLRLFQPSTYISIDREGPAYQKWGIAHICHDYRKGDLQQAVLDASTWSPDAFCSLFSTEITAPFTGNYSLYERLFDEFPTLKWGVVAGFYYTDKREQLVVEEVGGLKSHQSIEAQHVVRSDVFSERRVYIDAPSTLFGPNVVEVWKRFDRRGGD